ncbi:hypothetical protein [Spirosoma luteum]|uniref:hypothetical protein n=1 Tax=Spirosoma luteum TaxID=431553 RepID=UPI0012FBDAFE|nr:hypothetical protein [Spirosoma luteum]
MKITTVTVALLIGVASVSALAQAGGNAAGTSGRQSTSTAQGVPTSRPGSQSATSGQKGGSEMGSGSTRSQSGSGSAGSQSRGNRIDSKAGGKRVNQQAAGVPNYKGYTGRTVSKPSKKQ